MMVTVPARALALDLTSAAVIVPFNLSPQEQKAVTMLVDEVEKRTGIPGAFIESDLVDPRYFSAANVKNRIESYLQMIDQKRSSPKAEPQEVRP